MDPEAVLEELRSLGVEVIELEDLNDENLSVAERSKRLIEIANEQAEKFQALDIWLSKGGFLPKDWRKNQDGPSSEEPTKD